MSIRRSIKELTNGDLRLIIDRKSQELNELRDFVKHNEGALEAQIIQLQRELDEKDVLITNMTLETEKQRTSTWLSDQALNRIQTISANNNENNEMDCNSDKTNENIVTMGFDEVIHQQPRKIAQCRMQVVEKSYKSLTTDTLQTATREVGIMDRWFI